MVKWISTAQQKLVEYHVAAGSDGLICGWHNRWVFYAHYWRACQSRQQIVEFADGRIPVIAGTSANATHESVLFSRLLNGSGIAGCLSVTPYYNKPTPRRFVPTCQAMLKLWRSTNPIQCSRSYCRWLLPETVAACFEIKTSLHLKRCDGWSRQIAIHRELCERLLSY